MVNINFNKRKDKVVTYICTMREVAQCRAPGFLLSAFGKESSLKIPDPEVAGASPAFPPQLWGQKRFLISLFDFYLSPLFYFIGISYATSSS